MSRWTRIVLVFAVVTILVTTTGPALHAAPTPAPAFSLELFNGGILRLAELKGTAVILLFWANW